MGGLGWGVAIMGGRRPPHDGNSLPSLMVHLRDDRRRLQGLARAVGGLGAGLGSTVATIVMMAMRWMEQGGGLGCAVSAVWCGAGSLRRARASGRAALGASWAGAGVHDGNDGNDGDGGGEAAMQQRAGSRGRGLCGMSGEWGVCWQALGLVNRGCLMTPFNYFLPIAKTL